MEASVKVLVGCPFCGVERPLVWRTLAYAIYDTTPVSNGHVLLIPRRHVSDWFETTSAERRELMALADELHARFKRELAADGFNLGINVGEAAGQTVAHVHMHLIPRFWGDTANPRGGVRGVIPERQNY
jgi:diadenosine tetraphosphate (Ap4A) HIT family hydrolase